MWLNSKISGCVDGGSTYLDGDHHVDDENSHGHYHSDENSKDDVDDEFDVFSRQKRHI